MIFILQVQDEEGIYYMIHISMEISKVPNIKRVSAKG